ncbi:glutamate--tRNA ligase [Candidatus Parcubacteria bacterium]|nr:glutamate--tRNA ligase [Candidatus Parcubacteria bacterium]
MTEEINNKKIVVRMAPSPTGNLHIGGARTALFNFLFAQKQNGKFILRIEDTDKERSKQEFEDNILESFEWLGLKYDELFRQSERTEIYVSYVKKMLENGSAYISKETPTEENPRTEVIRLKNPNKKIDFEDVIRGEVSFDTTELGDLVIAKSVNEPLYHLAVVVDDFEMGVTHVIRGEEHLSNTPRQILIQEAIGAPRPIYAHIPLILAPDRSKLSKRAGAVSVLEYKNQGILPESLLNYLALLGWNPGTEQEIFTLSELIEIFDLSRIHKGGAIFDAKKLDWVNKEHIKLLPREEQLKFIAKEFDATTTPVLEIEKIPWKTSNILEAKTHLEHVLTLMPHGDLIMKYAEEAGKGNVLWPLRYALSGLEKSPDPMTLMEILGGEESKKRVEAAIKILGQ